MQQEILSLFTQAHTLKFNQIEKSLKKRSNKLAYHLKKMRTNNMLQKTGDEYTLAEHLESTIPYLSSKKAVMPIILIHVGNNKEALLIQRTKRPYQGYVGLPGGRLLQGESFLEAAKRIAKEKCNLDITPRAIKSITLEHVKKKQVIVHSFLLIVVAASARDKIKLTSISQNKKGIIKSDYKLITAKSQNTSIPVMISRQ